MRTERFVQVFVIVAIMALHLVAEAEPYGNNSDTNTTVLLRVATEGVKDKNNDKYIVPPAPAQARMTQAERTAFTFVVDAVLLKNRRSVDLWKADKKNGEGPLAVVEMHTMLRVLTEHLLTLRFSDAETTQKLCAGKLAPPADPSWDDQHGKVLYEHWWKASADFVKDFACPKQRSVDTK